MTGKSIASRSQTVDLFSIYIHNYNIYIYNIHVVFLGHTFTCTTQCTVAVCLLDMLESCFWNAAGCGMFFRFIVE